MAVQVAAAAFYQRQPEEEASVQESAAAAGWTKSGRESHWEASCGLISSDSPAILVPLDLDRCVHFFSRLYSFLVYISETLSFLLEEGKFVNIFIL